MIEVRSPGMDKGNAVRTLVEELDARAFLFAGDDLGDLEAFQAVADLRDAGDAHPAGLLRLRTSRAPSLELADVVVKGPEGVLDLLRRLTETPRGIVRTIVTRGHGRTGSSRTIPS